MEKVLVKSYGFVKPFGNQFICLIHLHIDGSMLELQTEDLFNTKELAYEYIKSNIGPITARLCIEFGLEVTAEGITTTVQDELH